MTVMPELDVELCNGCGLCVAACHGGGIVAKEGKVRIVVTENCDFCGVCEVVCPQCAIKCFYVLVLKEHLKRFSASLLCLNIINFYYIF